MSYINLIAHSRSFHAELGLASWQCSQKRGEAPPQRRGGRRLGLAAGGAVASRGLLLWQALEGANLYCPPCLYNVSALRIFERRTVQNTLVK